MKERNAFPFLLLCLSLLLFLPAPGCGSREETVARVDGKAISKNDLRRYLNLYLDDSPAPDKKRDSGRKQDPVEVRTALQQLINEELLLLSARQRGLLDKKSPADPKERRAAMRRMLIELGRKVPYPSLIEARQYYEKHPEEFRVATRYRIEHLLFPSEHEARQVRAEIKRGRLSLAEAGSRGLGGARVVDEKQRPVSARELSPELARALPGLKIGQLSPVIATPYGYHLIRIVQSRPPGLIPFAEIENRIKDAIFARRLRANYQKWLKRQKQAHTIEIFPERLKNL